MKKEKLIVTLEEHDGCIVEIEFTERCENIAWLIRELYLCNREYKSVTVERRFGNEV